MKICTECAIQRWNKDIYGKYDTFAELTPTYCQKHKICTVLTKLSSFWTWILTANLWISVGLQKTLTTGYFKLVASAIQLNASPKSNQPNWADYCRAFMFNMKWFQANLHDDRCLVSVVVVELFSEFACYNWRCQQGDCTDLRRLLNNKLDRDLGCLLHHLNHLYSWLKQKHTNIKWCLNPLLLWTHQDTQSPAALDVPVCTVSMHMGRSKMHY